MCAYHIYEMDYREWEVGIYRDIPLQCGPHFRRAFSRLTNGFSLSSQPLNTISFSAIITSKQLHTLVHISGIKSYRLAESTPFHHTLLAENKTQRCFNMQQQFSLSLYMSHLISSVFYAERCTFPHILTFRKFDIYARRRQDDINMR